MMRDLRIGRAYVVVWDVWQNAKESVSPRYLLRRPVFPPVRLTRDLSGLGGLFIFAEFLENASCELGDGSRLGQVCQSMASFVTTTPGKESSPFVGVFDCTSTRGPPRT